ncbi:hypothetical protein KJ612_18395 [Myxococcota bacterium]|nr:hypothetical protein [Myxococcota bacterium]MBU1410909.1 hypothetical protein [Myxococcota bacterium]
MIRGAEACDDGSTRSSSETCTTTPGL